MIEILKYKAQRIGLLSTVYAVCNDSKRGSVVIPVGNMEIAPSKRAVKAITVFGEDLGTWNNCKEAKSYLVNKFEERAKYRQTCNDILKKRLEQDVIAVKELSDRLKKENQEIEIPFEKLESKEIKKEIEKDIDNTNSKIYNRDIAMETITATTNKTKESVDMKKSNVGTKVVGKVASFSKTREATENMKVTMKETFAEVLSGSGEKYVVTKNSCTCKDSFFRGEDKFDEQGNLVRKGVVCRHRTAVADVLEQMKKNVKYW